MAKAIVYRWIAPNRAGVRDIEEDYPWAISLDREQEPWALVAEHSVAVVMATALAAAFPELDLESGVDVSTNTQEADRG